MKKVFALLLCATSLLAQNISVKSINKIRYVSGYMTPGQSVGQAIYNACADATVTGTQFGSVIIEPWVTSGWYTFALPLGCNVEDHRGTGGYTQTVFNNGVSYYLRATNSKPFNQLSIPAQMLLQFDAWSGGFSDIANTKTQWQAIRVEMQGRTIGERKATEMNLNCQGIGDCIGGMFAAYDFGGYSTGGDEGAEGVRGSAYQGDGFGADGNYPRGQAQGTCGYGANYVCAAWSGGTNANLGVGRWVINTSWSPYSTGSILSGSGTSPACTLVGSGTTWTSLGTGDHSDLALEFVPYDGSGGAKWVVPVNHITDNTHLNVTFGIAEIGNSCFNAAGNYVIYKGSQVIGLGDPAIGVDPTAVLLTQASANVFRVLDNIEEALSPGFHGTGVVALVGKVTNGPVLGSGVVASNVFTPLFQNAFRATGNWQNGISFDGGTLAEGVNFAQPVSDSLIRSNDITASSQRIFNVLSSGGSQRYWEYDRTNDWWHTSGNVYISGTTSQLATNSSIQSNVQFYLGYSNAAFSGEVIQPTVTLNSNVPLLDIAPHSLAGLSMFRVEEIGQRVIVNDGSVLQFYSDNKSTLKALISGATGAASFSMLGLGGAGASISNGINFASGGQLAAAGTTIANVNASSFDVASGMKFSVNGGASIANTSSLAQYVGTITTTAAVSDNLSVTGLTSSGHCSAQATNATAATTLTGVWTATGAGSMTLNHSASSGGTFAIFCSFN